MAKKASESEDTPEHNGLRIPGISNLLEAVFGSDAWASFSSIFDNMEPGAESDGHMEKSFETDWDDEIPVQLDGFMAHVRAVVRTKGSLKAKVSAGGIFKMLFKPEPPKELKSGKDE